MDNKNVNLLLRILRIVLPLSAIVMGILPGSYKSVRLDPASTAEAPKYLINPSNYFDFSAQTLLDWVPLICMLLCMATLVAAIVAAVQETEKTLTVLANFFCFAMIADAALLMFCGAVTPLMWVIGGVLLAGLIMTSLQEMKMEDANRK